MAFTFITTDQGKLSGDIVKAFQLSKVDVPTDLQKLWDDYVAEQKAVSTHLLFALYYQRNSRFLFCVHVKIC